MDIKVDGKIYKGEDILVMVKLTQQDKENIKNMPPNCTIYSMYPGLTYTKKQVVKELEIFKAE